jgi:hypothetical protein
LAHLRVHCLSQGGPGGHCRYPAYRVPLHTSFKSRQGARRASTRRHPIVPDPAFQPRWALASSRVQWFQILPPCSRGLRRCYVSRGSGPRLPAREGSGAATCTIAPDPTSRLGRAPMPSRVPRHSVSHMDLRNKERISCPRHVSRLVCFQGTCKMSRHAASSSPARHADRALQCSSTVQRHVTNHSLTRLVEDVTP